MTPPRRETVEPALAIDADVAALVAAFEDCTLPFSNWTHRAHLAVAVSYLKQLPFPAALNRVRECIQRYNRVRGSGEGYHETITVLFMRAVASYLARHPEASPAGAPADLAACDMAWVRRHYSTERLDSAEAKVGWVEPDVQPLDFGAATGL
jgi:hypothetical protein